MTPGTSIGQFKVIRKLGDGAMGEVFLALDPMLGREVALKMLRLDLACQPHLVERFRAEARMLAQLHHPNIAAVHAMLQDRDRHCMVMEYVPGTTLDDRLRQQGSMPASIALPLFDQVLSGVEHAHGIGIIHRDLKPGNLMLTPRGQVKVMDFGIAKALGTTRMTTAGRIVGTLEYMSPEQIRGLDVTPSSDIYSLGIVLYEMLTGRVPFKSDSEFELMRAQVETQPPPPRTFAPGIDPAIDQILIRTLAKRPEQRFRSIGEFRNALMDRSARSLVAISTAPNLFTPPTKFGDYSRPGPIVRTSVQQSMVRWRNQLVSFGKWLAAYAGDLLLNAPAATRRYYYIAAALISILAISILLFHKGEPAKDVSAAETKVVDHSSSLPPPPAVPTPHVVDSSSQDLPAINSNDPPPGPPPIEPERRPRPREKRKTNDKAIEYLDDH